jgi:hypothetical protein
MSSPRLITPYPTFVTYTPKYIIRNGLPPRFSPSQITPEVDNYFNLLQGLKRRGMNVRAAQRQADSNHNIRDWIAQEESKGIDLTEWLAKQGYQRNVRGGSRNQRKQRQRQKKSKKTRRV